MMVSQEMLDAVIEGANAKVADLESRIRELEAALEAADMVAHDLTYRDHKDVLEPYWQKRGGHDKCTVCNYSEQEREVPK